MVHLHQSALSDRADFEPGLLRGEGPHVSVLCDDLVHRHAGTVSGPGFNPTYAEDAEWGCQILLCAASQSPSWHGVPYCVPPMKRLITAMSKPHFSWPICQAANSGKSGHQEYEDCPAGMTPAAAPNGRDSVGFGDTELRQCIKVVNQCRDRSAFRSQYGDQDANARNGITITPIQDNSDNWTGGGCEVKVSLPRPRKADPYYFDIPNENGEMK